MSEIDMGQEWRRLQDVYAGMSEEELQGVADDGFELTDLAKQALSAEISKRGLQVVVRLAQPPEDLQVQGPVDESFEPADLELSDVLFQIYGRNDAKWAKKILGRAGIPCYFGPDLVDDPNLLPASFDAGLKIMVRTDDFSRANQVLHQFFESRGVQQEEGPDYSAHCPRCHSPEIVFQGLDCEAPSKPSEGFDNEQTDYASEDDEAEESNEDEQRAENAKFCWSCDACGYRWTDDGVEK